MRDELPVSGGSVLEMIDVSSDLIEGAINSILASLLRSLASLDHLVRPRQHVRWNRQADLLRGFKIDDQLELIDCLHA